MTLAAGNDAPAFTDLNVKFHPGRVSVVVGPPASGKRLLVEAVIGLRRPKRGAVLVDSLNPVTDTVAVRRRVCFVPPHLPVRGHRSVFDHVRFMLAVSGGAPASERKIITALRMSELPDRQIAQRADALEPFERLCVWLAVHRLRGTRALVIDEPDEDVSASRAADVGRILGEAASDGRVVLVTSRDAEFASAVANDVFRIERGVLR